MSGDDVIDRVARAMAEGEARCWDTMPDIFPASPDSGRERWRNRAYNALKEVGRINRKPL